MPGFRAVHATVAAAAALICHRTLADDNCMASRAAVLGLVAVVFFCYSAPIIGWQPCDRRLEGLVWVAALITLMTESGQAVMRQIVSGPIQGCKQ